MLCLYNHHFGILCCFYLAIYQFKVDLMVSTWLQCVGYKLQEITVQHQKVVFELFLKHYHYYFNHQKAMTRQFLFTVNVTSLYSSSLITKLGYQPQKSKLQKPHSNDIAYHHPSLRPNPVNAVDEPNLTSILCYD